MVLVYLGCKLTEHFLQRVKHFIRRAASGHRGKSDDIKEDNCNQLLRGFANHLVRVGTQMLEDIAGHQTGQCLPAGWRTIVRCR